MHFKISLASRMRMLTAVLLFLGLSGYDSIVLGQVSVRSSGTYVQLFSLAPAPCCRESPPTCDCTRPLMWAVAMPCDVFICNQGATLTYSDELQNAYPITLNNGFFAVQFVREILRAQGTLDDPDDPIPQCDDPMNPNQQRVAVFIQECVPGPCRNLTGGVETILSFEVCPVCTPGEEFCSPQPQHPECIVGNPQRLDPDCFIDRVGLGGLVTLEIDVSDDPPFDPDLLDFGDTFVLPPPPRSEIPAVSEWGLLIMSMLLLVALKLRFRRHGFPPNAR